MKKLLVSVLAMSTIAFTGCSVRMADMTVASTKNYNLNSNQFVKGERVKGEDKVPVILFPLGIPNFKTAVDRAIATQIPKSHSPVQNQVVNIR